MNADTHQALLKREFENGSKFVFECAKCCKYYKHVSWKLNYGVCGICKRDLKYKPAYSKKEENDVVLDNPFIKKKKNIDKLPSDYF